MTPVRCSLAESGPVAKDILGNVLQSVGDGLLSFPGRVRSLERGHASRP